MPYSLSTVVPLEDQQHPELSAKADWRHDGWSGDFHTISPLWQTDSSIATEAAVTLAHVLKYVVESA